MAAERTELRSEELGRPFPGTLDHVGPFEVSGVLGDSGAGDTVTVGWKEGEPYGDEATLILLQIEARVFDGVPLGPLQDLLPRRQSSTSKARLRPTSS